MIRSLKTYVNVLLTCTFGWRIQHVDCFPILSNYLVYLPNILPTYKYEHITNTFISYGFFLGLLALKEDLDILGPV